MSMSLEIRLLKHQPDVSSKTRMCSGAWREDINHALLDQSIVHVCVQSTRSSRNWCSQEAGGSGCVSQSCVVILCQHPHFLYQVLLNAAFLTLVFQCPFVDVDVSLPQNVQMFLSSVDCGRKFKVSCSPCSKCMLYLFCIV